MFDITCCSKTANSSVKAALYLGDATTYCFFMDVAVTIECRAFVWLAYVILFSDLPQYLHGDTTAAVHSNTPRSQPYKPLLYLALIICPSDKKLKNSCQRR
jgi:hypothetical protein